MNPEPKSPESHRAPNIVQQSVWLTMGQAARWLMRRMPRVSTRRMSAVTVWRYIHEGLRGPEGKVKLEGRRVAGRLCTTRNRLRRFLRALEGPVEPVGPPIQTSREFKDQQRRSAAILDAAGIGTKAKARP